MSLFPEQKQFETLRPLTAVGATAVGATAMGEQKFGRFITQALDPAVPGRLSRSERWAEEWSWLACRGAVPKGGLIAACGDVHLDEQWWFVHTDGLYFSPDGGTHLTRILDVPHTPLNLSGAQASSVITSALAGAEAAPALSRGALVLSSSSSYLTDGFAWAKRTALSKVHPDNGGCYQAALPDRSGYCQRDYVHQIDGAALLGLHRENLAMLKCFAANQTQARGCFTLWEINYDGTPMACDYRDDGNFWRNTAGMFDLLHGAYRIHRWTGDPALVQDDLLQRFCARTINDFSAKHDRNGNGIVRVNGSPMTPSTKLLNGSPVSGVTIRVRTGQRRTVTLP